LAAFGSATSVPGDAPIGERFTVFRVLLCAGCAFDLAMPASPRRKSLLH